MGLSQAAGGAGAGVCKTDKEEAGRGWEEERAQRDLNPRRRLRKPKGYPSYPMGPRCCLLLGDSGARTWRRAADLGTLLKRV